MRKPRAKETRSARGSQGPGKSKSVSCKFHWARPGRERVRGIFPPSARGSQVKLSKLKVVSFIEPDKGEGRGAFFLFPQEPYVVLDVDICDT